MTLVRSKGWAPQAMAAVLAISVCAPPRAAQAETVIKGNKKKAERHQKAAFRAIKLGDLDTGLVELEEAYLAYPDPKFLYNIAVAQDLKPNNCRVANEAYERFFEKCSGCETESLARTRHDRLLNRCIVPVTIKTLPPGARISIDGEAQGGVTPIVAKVWAGELRVVAQREGYQTEELTAAILEAKPRDIVIAMVRRDTGMAAVSSGAGPTGDSATTLQVPTFEETETRGVPSWAIWTSGAASVVAAGIGVGLGVAAQSEADSVNSDGNLRPSIRAERGDDAENMALGANIAFGIAGAAAVTTIVLLLWPELAGGSDASAAHRPSIESSPGVVSLSW